VKSGVPPLTGDGEDVVPMAHNYVTPRRGPVSIGGPRGDTTSDSPLRGRGARSPRFDPN
jgi:hypothetical protein